MKEEIINLTIVNNKLSKKYLIDDKMKDINEKDNNNKNFSLCQKCKEKLNLEKLNDIILNNNKIKDSINDIKLKLENIILINNSFDSLKIQLKKINEGLFKAINEINKNNEIIFNLMNNNYLMINEQIKINNDLNEKNDKKNLSDINPTENNKIKNKKEYLNKIKSNYIMKVIFSNLNEKNKLKIIKYNKNLQNKLSVNLINYKLYTGIYIEYESKTEVKEYYGDTGNLRFKGKYLNGKRNGKGKEYYDNGYLMYEGEYLNGKRNGKGEEYYDNGYLMFEGEYLNGKRNGKGKEYFYVIKICSDDYDSYDSFDKSILMFEGEYLNGIKWNGKIYDKMDNFTELKNGGGYIKEYSNINGLLLFEGNYLNGKRNGKGKEYNDNKIIFEGEYKNDKRWNGKGYDGTNNILYELKNGNGKIKEYNNKGHLEFEGEYLNGERNGKGKEYFRDGELMFEGEYLNGERNGKGKEYYDNGKLMFEGEYSNNKRNGEGKEYYNNGYLKFEGIYLYNYRLRGKLYIKGKLEYEGDYLYDQKCNGKGYDENGNIIYELNNGNGKVKEYNYNGNILFDGEYLNGKKNGKGKEYDDHGIIYFYGEYLNGQKWNGIEIDFSHNYNEYTEIVTHFLLEYEYINGKKLRSKFKICLSNY